VREITEEWHSVRALKARLDRPHSEFLIADSGEAIVGMAFASATDRGDTVMLHQLYVRPDHQGRGVGSLLLDEIQDCFPEARKVRLEVEEENQKAIGFYLSH